MSHDHGKPMVAHGWTVFAHPLFLDQLESLIQKVELSKQKDPVGYRKKNAAKRLADTWCWPAFWSGRQTS